MIQLVKKEEKTNLLVCAADDDVPGEKDKQIGIAIVENSGERPNPGE